MSASILQPPRSLPVWLSAVVWLSAFLSPTAYFLLILLVDMFHISSPPATLVWLPFFLIPVFALFICESVVWSRSRTVGSKIGWMVFTLLAMLLQFGIILMILRAILVTRIAYVQ
jgi:hypothetical protein